MSVRWFFFAVALSVALAGGALFAYDARHEEIAHTRRQKVIGWLGIFLMAVAITSLVVLMAVVRSQNG